MRVLALNAWHALLAHHTEPPFESVCVHIAELEYGTRSSTIIRVGPDGLQSFLFADGPPCPAAYSQ